MTNVAPPEDHSSSRSTKRVIVVIGRAVSYLVYAYLIVVEIILLLGFILLLFGANTSSGFVEWAYRNYERVMEPFRGIFGSVDLGTASNDVPAILDTSALFAMVIYGIIAILMSSAIHWLTGVVHRLDREQAEEDRRLAYAAAIRRNQSPLDPSLPQMPPDVYGNPVDTQHAAPGGATVQSAATQPGSPMEPPTQP